MCHDAKHKSRGFAMRAAIAGDKATLRALKPLEVVAYLRAKGWRQTVDRPGKSSLWTLLGEAGTEFDVTLPDRSEIGDYSLRMAEVLETLADAEQRSQLDVLRDVQTTASDLIRIRAPRGDAENGTLPLNEAVAFVERSRDMMLAAACAAMNKRPVYAKRKAQQAMDYLGHIRMGQTERGSYVLTILSPVAPELAPAQDVLLPMEPVVPYERRVTQTLIESLAALGEAAREAAVRGNMTPFEVAVGRGVSANLCDAVVGLSDVSPAEGLDIQISWSRTRPVDAGVVSRVLLRSDAMPLIEEAARQFRQTAPSDDADVIGIVTRLARGEKATQGEVTITASVEGQYKLVKVMLGEDDYGKAVRAHELREVVSCTGDLVREGHSYWLRNPRHFTIVPDDLRS